MKIISDSVEKTLKIGKKISQNLGAGDIICLFGRFGSGKTVLTKGIAWGLGIDSDKIVSPSFVLIRQHTQGKLPLFHIDLYRLKEPKDILSLGYEEFLYNGGITVIEWADRLRRLLPKAYLKIILKIIGKSKREIKIIPIGKYYIRLLDRIFDR